MSMVLGTGSLNSPKTPLEVASEQLYSGEALLWSDKEGQIRLFSASSVAQMLSLENNLYCNCGSPRESPHHAQETWVGLADFADRFRD